MINPIDKEIAASFKEVGIRSYDEAFARMKERINADGIEWDDKLMLSYDGKRAMTPTTQLAYNVFSDKNHYNRLYRKLAERYVTMASEDKTFARTFTRTIWQTPGWSNSVDCFAEMMARGSQIYNCMLAHEVNGKDLCHEESAILLSWHYARAYDFPFTCVGRKLVDAALMTKPFDEWDLKLMPLPFNCITFILPKGTRLGGEEMTHITIYLTKEDENGNRKIVFIGANYSIIPFIGVHSPRKDGIIDFRSEEIRTPAFEGSDVEASLTVMQFALNLVGIMHARANLVREPAFVREVGKGEKRRDVRDARVLGLAYSYRSVENPSRSEPTDNAHRKVAHWRRGHWHTVRFGRGRSQRKLEWFEPVYVNAGK